MKLLIIFALSVLLLNFCGSNDKKAIETKHSIDVLINKEKQDTITINERAAVLYSPDTVQIDEAKKKGKEDDFYVVADDNVYYTGMAYEFLDSMKLKTFNVEGKKVLRFIKEDKSQKFINLGNPSVLWGIYLFSPAKDPKLIDMTSIDEEYKSYFGK